MSVNIPHVLARRAIPAQARALAALDEWEDHLRWVALVALTVFFGLIWGWEDVWIIPAVATVSVATQLVNDASGIGDRIPESVKRAYGVVGLALFGYFIGVLIRTLVFGWWWLLP